MGEEDLQMKQKVKYGKVKQATLALIGCKFLDPLEKQIVQDIFNIMDESGDGKLQQEEIVNGFNYISEFKKDSSKFEGDEDFEVDD